jgi:ATP-dependent protease HslVU (ClpYQ) ATPase subunit
MNYYRQHILNELTNRQKVTAYGSVIPIVGNLIGLLGYDLYTKIDPSERIADLERELRRAKRQGNDGKVDILKTTLNKYLDKIEKKAQREAQKDKSIKYRHISKQISKLRSENQLNEGIGDALSQFIHSGEYTKIRTIIEGLTYLQSAGGIVTAAELSGAAVMPVLGLGLAYGLGVGYVTGKGIERIMADIDPSGVLKAYDKKLQRALQQKNQKKAMKIIDNILYELRRLQLNYKKTDDYKQLQRQYGSNIHAQRLKLHKKLTKK